MENSFLYVQWVNPTDASRFVIDGVACEYSETDEQKKLVQLMMHIPTFKEICRRKGRVDLSPSFRCSYKNSKDSSFYCIEGNFEEQDSAGRKLVFVFVTHESDTHKCVEILKEYSRLLGVTPHQEDLEEIKKQKFKKKKDILIY